MRRSNYSYNKKLVIVLVVLVFTLSISYAALSSVLNLKFNTITQSALSFDVGFDTNTVTGTSNGGSTCGSVTPTRTSITGVSVNLNGTSTSPQCSYRFRLTNTGDLNAELISIEQINPSSTSCTKVNDATMDCGRIRYRLCWDSNSCSSLVSTGYQISNGSSRYLYLVVGLTSQSTYDDDFSQNGFGFKFNFKAY